MHTPSPMHPTATTTLPAVPAMEPGSLNIGVDSAALLQGQKAVNIIHNGQAYRLQATKLGKLILTK